MNVLGFDPGFAKIGWGIVSLDGELIGAGLIETRKRGSRSVTEDNISRTVEIAGELEGLFARANPVLVAAEGMSWPRNASVSAKTALGWGSLITIAALRQTPIATVTPMDLKLGICGNGKASKEEVRAAVLGIEGLSGTLRFLKKIPESKREHPFDAIAAAYVLRNHPILLGIRRAVGAKS